MITYQYGLEIRSPCMWNTVPCGLEDPAAKLGPSPYFAYTEGYGQLGELRTAGQYSRHGRIRPPHRSPVMRTDPKPL